MNAQRLLILQSILVFVQVVNAAVGSIIQMDPVWAVLIAASAGALQFYCNRAGNLLQPPEKKQDSSSVSGGLPW